MIQLHASKTKKMSISMSMSPINRMMHAITCNCNRNCNSVSWNNIRHRFKLYCYPAPNALLVLINDILALYTLSLYLWQHMLCSCKLRFCL